MEDHELLREYAEHRKEVAFAEVVSRHINLVYSTALRMVGDPQFAQDVAQTVFIELARNPKSIREPHALAGWLYRTTRFSAASALRTEQRRRQRENVAMEMNVANSSPETEWQSLAPHIEEAMATLDADDQNAVVLRFFENKSLREVGAALGVSDDAAQKRVSRALEKLRSQFVRHGITTTAGALSVTISANAVQVAPAGLAATLTSASLAAGTGTTMAALKLMTMTTLQKSIITTIVVAGLATPLIINYRGQAELREENSSLRQKLQQQVDASAQLETDNAQLLKLVGQATNKSLSDEQFRELLRLRGEVGQLRNQKAELEKLRAENSQIRAARSPALPNEAAQNYLSKESWAFVGYADPESAFQSVVWAMSKGDLRTILAGVSPEEQARMEKQFAGKSEEEIVASSAAEMEKIKGFRILKNEAISEDEVILTIFGDGKDETTKIRVKRLGNEWKLAGRVKDGPR